MNLRKLFFASEGNKSKCIIEKIFFSTQQAQVPKASASSKKDFFAQQTKVPKDCKSSKKVFFAQQAKIPKAGESSVSSGNGRSESCTFRCKRFCTQIYQLLFKFINAIKIDIFCCTLYFC